MPRTNWQAKNPGFKQVVVSAFDAQTAMATMGVRLEEVEPGFVALGLDCHDGAMSHLPPVVHGGTIGMIADSSMGFAVLSLVPAGGNGFTAEYKINFLRPAIGDRLIARGTVLKPGASLTVATSEVSVVDANGEKVVATALGTFLHQ